jgi:hypothetical protein
MKSQDDMSDMFDSLHDLTIYQRTTIKERYRFLMGEYRTRCRLYTFLFYSLRMTMTVGSLAVPALLSLKSLPATDDFLYWFTWGLSLAVTTANGLTTLFKLDKRYFMLHAIAERLRTETWQYLSLAGRYSGHYGGRRPTHRNQYVYYCSQIEKIRMKHIDDEFIRNADMGEKNKVSTHQQQISEDEDINRDSIIPTPPDQANLMTSPMGKRRRDSLLTVGEDDTIVHVSGQIQNTKEEAEGEEGNLSVSAVQPSAGIQLSFLPPTPKV